MYTETYTDTYTLIHAHVHIYIHIPDLVVYGYNPSTGEVETEGYLGLTGKLVLLTL